MLGKISTLLLLACCGAVNAAVFDFRNDIGIQTVLDNEPGPVAITNGPLIATFTASDGTMNITGSGFGINSTIPSDDTDGFDVGEWLDITFNSAATLSNITVSSWSTANGDQASLSVNGSTVGTITSTGSSDFTIAIPADQTLRIASIAGTIGNGWSLDRIEVGASSPPPQNTPPVLDPIGNKSVNEGQELRFVLGATDVDGDPITITATNLPTGAVFTNNVFNWSNAAPTGIYLVTFTAADDDGSDSETIRITVTEKPSLFISEIADPAGTGGGNFRFVEIYNTGNGPVDLSAGNWHLSIQVNGEDWDDIALTNLLEAGQSYVIAKNAADFESAYGFAPDLASSKLDGTGDDGYFLYKQGDHSCGILVDAYGVIDTDGTDEPWEYTDGQAFRNKDILEPNPAWTASEWTLVSGAITNDMTPGIHGPTPTFHGLENPFVIFGDDLNLNVTATNPIRSDIITLSATNLPPGVVFTQTTGTNRVSSTLVWVAPPIGVYTATLIAEGAADSVEQTITITVSDTAQLDGKFHGWNIDTIVKLDNGQFWRNTGGGSTPLSPPLHNPDATLSLVFGNYRIAIDGVPSYQTIEQLDITESRLESDQTRFANGTIYELQDGTFWQQISFESSRFAADARTAWRWAENENIYLRFLDRDDQDLGTCQVTAVAEPTGGPLVTEIDGYFRGWKNQRVFALANGEFWQQTTSKSSVETLFQPTATLTNWFGTWRLYVEGAASPGYVEVQQRTDVTRTKIAGLFYGVGLDEFFKLQNGEWWRQTSIDTSASIRSNPEVLVWGNTIELPDEGRSVSAKQLTVLSESTITNAFTGLDYANRYQLKNGDNWIQSSLENIHTNPQEPNAMLWLESTDTRMLIRTGNDQTIGSCIVLNPDADDDGDQLPNAVELIAGTAVDDAKDFFLISDVAYNDASQAILNWKAVEGRIYTVEWTPSLNTHFQTLETNVSPPWTDTISPPSPDGFYKIRVQLAD